MSTTNVQSPPPPQAAGSWSFSKVLISELIKIRYMAARSLQTRILPSFLPVIPLPYLRQVAFVNVGQVLLMVPWILIFVASYHKTFTTPDLAGSGTIASYALVAAFLTASKSNSVFLILFGLSFERMVPIHNLYACLALITSLFHGGLAYAGKDEVVSLYAMYGPTPNLWSFLWDGPTNRTGTSTTLCLVGLVLLSFFRIIRKYLYEPWLFSHIIFAVGVIAFGIRHSVPILFVPLAWWALDWVLRYVVKPQGRFPSKATIIKCADDLVEVSFPRTFNFQAGQFVRICIPAVGTLQFHPYTLSSSPFQNEATLHIRVLGGWSKALAALAERASSSGEEVNIVVEGPFGQMSMDLTNQDLYPVVLCISGGIGVTPCESVARQMIHEAGSGRKLDHLRFVWVVQDTDMVEAYPTVATDGSMELNEKLRLCHTDTSDSMEMGEIDNEHPSNNSNPFRNGRYAPEVYLTKTKDVAHLGPQFREGRPNILAIVEQTIAIAKRKNAPRVAVITCGPEQMVDSVRDACRKLNGSDGGPSIDVHHEIFHF